MVYFLYLKLQRMSIIEPPPISSHSGLVNLVRHSKNRPSMEEDQSKVFPQYCETVSNFRQIYANHFMFKKAS